MSKLIEQMHMDMTLRDLSPKTLKVYSWHVKQHQKFFGQNVENLDEEKIRQYLYYLRSPEKVLISKNNKHLSV
jgi:integrase/recombinase XerD